MSKEIVLTPEELYYLGRYMQAKYIDYAYVSAMKDIKQNYDLFEKETKNSLVNAGILMEDFSGNMELDPQAATLLKPIFFGEVETSIDVCQLGEESTITVNKFHFHDGRITMVTGQNNKLLIKSVDEFDIKQMVETLLPADYSATSSIVNEETEVVVTKLIVLKNIFVGKKSTVKTYIEANSVLYQESEEETESVSKDMFINDAYAIVKGV